MKKLLIQLFIFTGILLIVPGFLTFVLWRTHENFYKIDKLVAGKEKYLIGYTYNEKNYGYLKWAFLNSNEKKSVWTLGASRVLQFRNKMFDSSFYNAGYTIVSINDFRPFLKSIPEIKYPKYLILGLDHMMFNAACDSLTTTAPVKLWQTSFRRFPKPIIYQLALKDLFAGKFKFSTFKNDNAIHKIGLNAVNNNTGFRNDGSMFYGSQIVKLMNNDPTARDYNFSNTLDRIKQGNRRFEYGKSFNDKALIELDELLKFCSLHQIEVIGFLPPFADKVYNSMIESGHYPYLEEIFRKIKPFFEKYKYEVYDFSKVSLCNSNDQETIDGMHGGELTYQKLLIKILESGSVLNKVTNVERLKADLQKAKNHYMIYDY
jgi:hypothetical protein